MSIDSMIILSDNYDLFDLKYGGHIIAKSFGYETALFLEDNKLEIRDKLYYFSHNGFDEYILCRKPLSEKSVADNVIEHGVGGINIDECRIQHSEEIKTTNRQKNQGGTWDSETCGLRSNPSIASANPKGRFPSHLIHDGSEEITCHFPDSKSTGGRTIKRSGGGNVGSGKKSEKEWSNEDPGYGDDGSASRFFKTIKTQDELIEYFKKLITPKDGICRICQ